MEGNRGVVAVSIVSHYHGAMVSRLVDQVLACPEVGLVIVTCNVPEPHARFGDDRVVVLENPAPRGFGANHNAAFLLAEQPFWCVLNPDVQLCGNPFPALLGALRSDSGGVVAPLVKNLAGSVEDSVRHFPTVISLVKKLLARDASSYFFDSTTPLFCPDWVAGMFMLFRSEVFSALSGFDEGYFLYYEDVDICVRAWKSGMRVVICPSVSVVHDARRDSHHSFRHLRWHLSSMARYFFRYWGRLPRVPDRR